VGRRGTIFLLRPGLVNEQWQAKTAAFALRSLGRPDLIFSGGSAVLDHRSGLAEKACRRHPAAGMVFCANRPKLAVLVFPRDTPGAGRIQQTPCLAIVPVPPPTQGAGTHSWKERNSLVD